MAEISVKRGDDVEIVVTIKENGVVADITSWTITSKVKDAVDGTELVDFGSATLTDPTNGICSFIETNANTAAWTVGDYKCDIQLNNGSKVFSTITIDFKVVGDITE